MFSSGSPARAKQKNGHNCLQLKNNQNKYSHRIFSAFGITLFIISLKTLKIRFEESDQLFQNANFSSFVIRISA